MIPGEKIIWKMADVKSYSFDSTGEKLSISGTLVVTTYKFSFVPVCRVVYVNILMYKGSCILWCN
jgi:hypothetical protein